MTGEASSWIGVGHVARRTEGGFEKTFFPVAFWAASRKECEALLRDYAPRIDPALDAAQLSANGAIGERQGDADSERGLFWLENLLTAEQRAALSPLSAAEKALVLTVSDANPVAIGPMTRRQTQADTTPKRQSVADAESTPRMPKLGDALNWAEVTEYLPDTRIVYAPSAVPRFFRKALSIQDLDALTEVGDSFFPLCGYSTLRNMADLVQAHGGQERDACQFFGAITERPTAAMLTFGSQHVENFFEKQMPCVAEVGTITALHTAFPDAFGPVDPEVPLDEACDVLFLPTGNGAVQVIGMPQTSISELAASVEDQDFQKTLMGRHVKLTTGHVLVDRFGEGDRLVEAVETYHFAIYEIFRQLAKHDDFFPYAFEDMLVPTLMAAVDFGIPLHTLPQAIELANHKSMPTVGKISFLAGMRFTEEHRETLEQAVKDGQAARRMEDNQ